jgi:hypothetical protein
MKIGNVIASTIALCWGLAVLVGRLTSEAAVQGGSDSYNAGRSAGFVFAVILGLAGARGLYREIQRARAR